MSAHAPFSPSSFDRLFLCPASWALTKDLPEQTSPYAERGTMLHGVAEQLLRGEPATVLPADDYERLLTYVTFVKQLGGQQWYEQRLTLNEDVWGTSDAIVINGADLHVVDLKAGQGVPVSAQDNPQLLTYGAMAYKAFADFNDIKQVHVHIVQPWLDSTSSATYDIDRIVAHEARVLEIVDIAKRGDTQPVPGEKQCRFCKVRATCRARAQDALDAAKEDFMPPPLMSDDDIAAVLVKAARIKAWVSDIEDYALQQALAGKVPKGFKVVAGRSVRKYADEQAVASVLVAAGLTEAEIYERSLLTITRMEKHLGKSKFAELLGGLVVKSDPKPVLVSEGDSRPTTAQADFL